MPLAFHRDNTFAISRRFASRFPIGTSAPRILGDFPKAGKDAVRRTLTYRQLGEVLAHFVEDLLGRDDDEARFVEDALGGLAGGRREKDVSVRGDAS
ncbi:MAG: hypothetical protein RBU36_17370 [Thermoanaerobaculia bacterium]|nr:hypothetical protein [Thermoanaerobaculia bacterium]